MNQFQFSIIWESWPELMKGAYLTLNITCVSFVLALIVGVVVGISRSKSRFLKGLLAPYVELFRGTPLLIQLFFIYYAMPVTGFSMDNMTAAYVGVFSKFAK